MRAALAFVIAALTTTETLSLQSLHHPNALHLHPSVAGNCSMNAHTSLGQWETLDVDKYRVMDVYFDVKVSKNQKCDIFSIEGVPAASMVYTNIDAPDSPVVDAFYLNKALLLLFDAGAAMRTKLASRYSRVNMKNALNRNEFMLF